MENTLDIKRVRKLLIIGLIGTLIATTGDLILGWNKMNLTGDTINDSFSLYNSTSPVRFILANTLGVFGMILEILSLFSIFRLINENNKKIAHIYRAGIILFSFSALSSHSLSISMFYIYNKINSEVNTLLALKIAKEYMLYFVLLSSFIYIVSFFIIGIVQLIAILKKETILPKRAAIYSIFLGLIILLISMFLPNIEIFNALKVSALNVGFLIMYLGVLINVIKHIKKTTE